MNATSHTPAPKTRPVTTDNTPAAHLAAIHAKFSATRRELCDALIERDEEIDLALTAMVAGEHLLLVSPPGTGKSLLFDTLLGWVDGNRFAILMTKFTAPEEVLGPFSLKALRDEDRYVRVTTGRLPEAHACFLDELWKSSSAILNTLLRLMNEGVFESEGTWVKAPLLTCFAASNEWPSTETGKELSALLDRFVFRKTARPIHSAKGEDRLLFGGDHTPRLSTTISPNEIRVAQGAAKALPWSSEAKDALRDILRQLKAEGVIPGDRRKFKAVGAASAYAWLNGATEVKPDHLEVLAHVLWDDPTEQPAITAKVVATVANPTGMKINSYLLEAEEILGTVDVKDIGSLASSDTKLREIIKQLSALAPDVRAERAKVYVQSEVKRIRLATMDAIG